MPGFVFFICQKDACDKNDKTKRTIREGVTGMPLRRYIIVVWIYFTDT